MIQSVKAIAIGAVFSALGGIVSALIVAFLSAVTNSPILFVCGLLVELGFIGIGGFVTGLMARRLEVVHAAATGLAYLLVGVLLYHPSGTGPYAYPAWYNAACYVLMIPGAAAGGHLAHRKRLRVAEQGLLHQPSIDSFLSRLTYGAMVVWGIGETIDSIPSLVRLFGLAFMVYGSVVWSLALLLAIVGSIALMFRGPRVHRRRILIWYSLLGLVAFGVYAAGMPAWSADAVAAALPAIWLVRTIKYTPPSTL